MPELPEVQRAARTIDAAARGKEIARLSVQHPALQRRLSPERAARVHGRRIARVERRGKHQLLHLDDGSMLHVHFRMAGSWRVGRTGDPEERFARAVLELHDGTRVSLVDPRALTTLTLHDPGDDPLPRLGPEPFDPSFTPAALRAALAGRRGAIKPVLLDQRVVAGLGNIYAAEALWLARISPRARAAALRPERLRRLVTAIRQVLRRAPAARYAGSERASRWNVYDREGERCRRCGASIRRIVQSARSTYFCPRCQRA